MSTIKKSLQLVYADSPEILILFDQIDFTKLDVQYKQEMNSRISEEDVKLAEAMLNSDILYRYNKAIQEVSLALTRPIRDLMMFATENSKEGKLN